MTESRRFENPWTETQTVTLTSRRDAPHAPQRKKPAGDEHHDPTRVSFPAFSRGTEISDGPQARVYEPHAITRRIGIFADTRDRTAGSRRLVLFREQCLRAMIRNV